MPRVAISKLLPIIALAGWAGAAGAALDLACIPDLHTADSSASPDGASDTVDGPRADAITDAQAACAYDCLGGACLDGACQPFVVYQSSDLLLLNGLLIGHARTNDATDALYWLSKNGSVSTLPLKAPFVASASTLETLEDGDVSLFQLTARLGRVYWTCTGDDAGAGARIGEVRGSGAPITVVGQADGGPTIAPGGITIADTASGKVLVWANVTPDASIMTSSLDGTGIRFVTSFPERPGRMEPSITASTVYVACGPNAPGVTGVVYAVDIATGTTRPLWDASSANQAMTEFVEQPAVNGSVPALFGVQDSRSASGFAPLVIQQPLPAGPQTAISLGTAPGHAYGIASDGASSLFLAVADVSGTPGRIFRVDFTRFGAPAVQVAQTPLGAYRVVYWLRGNALFWTAGGSGVTSAVIYGMALPPTTH
jgi:hypothetical protein